MREVTHSPPANLFTIRLWRESINKDQEEWRGEIKHLYTQEVRYFRRWDELAELVPEMLSEES